MSLTANIPCVKLLTIVLALQVILGVALVVLVATDNLPFTDGDADGAAPAPRPATDRFDSKRAYELLSEQVELGPRPAGSRASRRLASRLRRIVPEGRYQPVPGGLRNVVGTVRGREPGYIVAGAHYDTKDIPGFVGAVDGASGTAVLAELARTMRRPRHTIKFVFFDGEESPRGVPDTAFVRRGLRGSKVAAPRLSDARAMVLLDFVGNRGLSLPREANSDPRLWERLRGAARRVGAGAAFPDTEQGAIADDHLPFIEQGVPSINLIDFDFACWHRTCDDLSAVSERSLDATGETVHELLRNL